MGPRLKHRAGRLAHRKLGHAKNRRESTLPVGISIRAHRGDSAVAGLQGPREVQLQQRKEQPNRDPDKQEH